jgi:hypothetical protein
LYGYRHGDAGIPVIDVNPNGKGGNKGSWKLTLNGADHTHTRKPMGVKHWVGLNGVTRPMIDRDDYVSAILGCIHRVSPDMPRITQERHKELGEFCDRIFPQFFSPLDWDELLTYEEYLDHVRPTKGERYVADLRRYHYERIGDFLKAKNGRTCSSFIKDEAYDEWKNARSIQGVSKQSLQFDTVSYFNRVIKSIEKQVYGKMEGTIKGLTPHERADLIFEFGDYFTKNTDDYKSYEASFSYEVFSSIQFRFYRYMLSKFPPKTSKAIIDLISNENTMVFKYFTYKVRCRRMSGDPDTALGNVVDNWVDTLFLLWKNGIDPSRATEMIFVEGDDKTMCLDGALVDAEMSNTHFRESGKRSKAKSGLTHEENDMCQLVTSTRETEKGKKVLLTDVWKVLAQYAVINVKYARAGRKVFNSLLRAKALSLLYLYRGCPVVHVLALKLLYVTRDVNVRDNHWDSIASYKLDIQEVKKMNWRDFAGMEITMEDRIALEISKDCPVAMQVKMEEIITTWDGKSGLDIPVEWFPEPWSVYDELYTTTHLMDEWVAPSTARRSELECMVRAMSD